MDVTAILKEHKSTIQQFRDNIKDTGWEKRSDVELLRWLIGEMNFSSWFVNPFVLWPDRYNYR